MRCTCGALILAVTVSGFLYHDPHTHNETYQANRPTVSAAASSTSRGYVLQAESGSYTITGAELEFRHHDPHTHSEQVRPDPTLTTNTSSSSGGGFTGGGGLTVPLVGVSAIGSVGTVAPRFAS